MDSIKVIELSKEITFFCQEFCDIKFHLTMSPFDRHFSLVSLKKERESRRNSVTLLKTTEISFLSITLRLNCQRSAQFHQVVVLFKMAAELLLFPGS